MVVPRSRPSMAKGTKGLRVWIRDYKNACKSKHLKCRIVDKFLITAKTLASLPKNLLEKKLLLGFCGARPRWTCKNCINPGQQIEGWDFISLQQGPQAVSPLLSRSALFGSQHHGCLAEPAACCELATGPAQPGLEVRAVVLWCEHAHDKRQSSASGQDDSRGLRDLLPTGYFTGFIGVTTGTCLSAAIWSRRWAARSNSKRDDASLISSSSSAITRNLS